MSVCDCMYVNGCVNVYVMCQGVCLSYVSVNVGECVHECVWELLFSGGEGKRRARVCFVSLEEQLEV